MAKGWGYSSLGNLILVLLEMKSGYQILGLVPTERVEGCGSVRAPKFRVWRCQRLQEANIRISLTLGCASYSQVRLVTPKEHLPVCPGILGCEIPHGKSWD